MRLELVTAPIVEPLTLAEAKLHLRVTSTTEDALITSWVIAAREHIEAALRRKLVTQTWRVLRDNFKEPIVLSDLAPVSAIVSVKYIDSAGVLQTLASSVYQLIKESPARLTLAFDQVWPDLRGDKEGVQIDATCGYGGAAAVPASIKAAMLLLVGYFDQQRSSVSAVQVFEVPGVAALLSPYMVAAF